MARNSLLLSVLGLAACASIGGNAGARMSVAEAERAFAADAQARTVNEAFIAAFADDGIMFRPAPVNAHEALRARPIPPQANLRWAPALTETAAAGDYAVSTGPSERGTRGQPTTGTGYFLSVWRVTNGQWRVVFDAGSEGPIAGPVNMQGGTVSTRILRPSPSRSDDLAQMRGDLMATERRLIEDYAELLRMHAAGDVRLYRDGHAPTATIAEAITLAGADAEAEWTPQEAFVSRSGDLGYIYGAVQQGDRTTGYVRIYRNQDGNWKVAYDLR